jgi:hypothetical protein
MLPIKDAACGAVGKQGSVPRRGEQFAVGVWVVTATRNLLPAGTATNLGEIAKSYFLIAPAGTGSSATYFPYGLIGMPFRSDHERSGSFAARLPRTAPDDTDVTDPSALTNWTVAINSRFDVVEDA